MTAQTYQMISYVGFVLAAVLLVVSILLWVRLGIWKIIGDLSGRTAKKSIEQIRKKNEESGKKSFRPTPAAMKRGTITDQITEDSRPPGPEDATVSLSRAEEGTTPLADRDSAAAAADRSGTRSGREPTSDGAATELLSWETAPLTETAAAVAFHVIQDIVIIHTDERIC